ncbi:hypothetical protein JCM6882_000124 [Rhodosporidiobolus microsporus]
MSGPARTAAALSGRLEDGPRMELEGAVQGQPAGSMNEQDAGGDSGAVKPSPFDRLPDELVLAILDDARPFQSLDRISINKRFSRLAFPIWANSLVATWSRGQSRRLEHLATRPDLQPLVKEVDGDLPESLPELTRHLSTVRLFTNLTYFGAENIMFGPYNAPLPAIFTDTLHSLPNLKRLKFLFEAPVSFEDTTFTVGSHLPNLRELVLYTHEDVGPGIAQLLSSPCPNVRTFLLFLSGQDTVATSRIPWLSLRSLDFTLPPPREDPTCADTLLEGLKRALDKAQLSPYSLRDFKLTTEVFLKEDNGTDLLYTDRQIPILFELFRAAQVQELSLLLRAELVVPDALGEVPSVTVLNLEDEGIDACCQETFSAMCDLLRLFPSTTSLSLSCATFGEPSEKKKVVVVSRSGRVGRDQSCGPAVAAPAAATEAKAEEPAFYPADDVRRKKVSRKAVKPAVVRASLQPGSVAIILAGRFRGKRVVVLSNLPSGLVVVTGPYKTNGVPLRRANPAYLIGTSTKVDVSAVDVSKFDDAYFTKEKKASRKGTEGEFFKEGEEKKAIPADKAADQKAVDKAILAAVAWTLNLAKYLAALFSLGKQNAVRGIGGREL